MINLIVFLSSFLVTSPAPCADPSAVVDNVRSLRLSGALAEAQTLAQDTLSCDGLAPEIGVALHLEMAKILDRFGLHRNTRPVPQALDHVQTAATLISDPSPAVEAALELARADYYYRAEMRERKFPTATRHAETAIRLFREVGDRHGQAEAVHRLGLIHFQRRELETARELFEQSLELDDAGGSRVFFRGEYNRHVAFVHLLSGDVSGAIPYYERSLQSRKEAGAVDASMFAAVSLASALVEVGRAREAEAPLLYALMIADKIDSPAGRSRATLVLGKMYEALEEPRSAEHAFESTLEAARAIDYDSIASQAEEALARAREVSLASSTLESREAKAITRINHFIAKPGSGDELYDLIHSFLPYIRESDGCLDARILRSTENADEVVVIEVWRDEESHRASAANVPEGTVQKAMALMAGPPTGAYYQ